MVVERLRGVSGGGGGGGAEGTSQVPWALRASPFHGQSRRVGGLEQSQSYGLEEDEDEGTPLAHPVDPFMREAEDWNEDQEYEAQQRARVQRARDRRLRLMQTSQVWVACVRRYLDCKALVCCVLMAVLVLGVGPVVVYHEFLPMLSEQATRPTADQFETYVALGRGASRANASTPEAFCALPLRMVPPPPQNFRVGLLAPLQMGGGDLAVLVSESLRVPYSLDTCELGVHFTRIDHVDEAAVRGLCSDFFFFSNMALVHMHSVESALYLNTLGYEPSVWVLPIRNPLEAAHDAYLYLSECDEVWTVECIAVRGRRPNLYDSRVLSL